MRNIFYILLLLPIPALAEVADKMPTQQSILITGAGLGIISFSIGYFRWWLSLGFLGFALLKLIETISLWNEYHMRVALLKELGSQYFVSLGVEFLMILVGSILGVWYWFKRRTPNKASKNGRLRRHLN